MHRHRQYGPKVCHICLQDVTLFLCTSLICFVFLCRLVSVNQRQRIVCLFFMKCVVLQPSPGWGDLYVPPMHISSLMLWLFCSFYITIPSVVQQLYLGIFLFLCVCLPLTCCQRGNSQHPATLPQATSWCATVRVVSWINMLMYKGMSVG